MIGEGLAFALFTGLCWSAIGIVLSCCAKEKQDVISYSLLQTALAAAACFVIYSSPGKIVFNCGFYLLCTVILAAAMLNALAQYLIKRAMDSGSYAPVWAMAQTAMLFPFLCGVICWGNRINGLNILGLVLLLAGILLPCRKGFRQPGNWLGLALAALLCYGILQTLYLLPSHMKELADPGTIRPALACLGNFIGWSIIAVGRREKHRITPTVIRMALIMVVLHTASVKTFFAALDALGKAGAGGIGIPFMLGVNLATFGFYTFIFLKEKQTFENLIAELLIPIGLLCLCL